MKSIASRQNPWFKRVREAIREHGEEIVIEGPKQVADALAGGWVPIAIIERGSLGDDAARSNGKSRGEPHLSFAPELFDALAETRSSQGVIGVFRRPFVTFDRIAARGDSIVVALDGVQDPGNVGTIVRLAAAFDAAGVAVLPGCADPFGPKAVRASVGAILTVPVVDVTVRDLLDSGLPLYAAEQGAGAARPPVRNAIVVFGSEGSGVSREIREAAKPIAIPMSTRVESLNVATAAAILLARSYEARIR